MPIDIDTDTLRASTVLLEANIVMRDGSESLFFYESHEKYDDLDIAVHLNP